MQNTTEPPQANSTADGKPQGLNNVIDQATAAAHPVIDQFSAKAHDTVNRLATAASHGADNFEVRSEQLSATGVRLSKALRDQVHRRPATVIGAAIATGFIISWLLKSRVS